MQLSIVKWADSRDLSARLLVRASLELMTSGTRFTVVR